MGLKGAVLLGTKQLSVQRLAVDAALHLHASMPRFSIDIEALRCSIADANAVEQD